MTWSRMHRFYKLAKSVSIKRRLLGFLVLLIFLLGISLFYSFVVQDLVHYNSLADNISWGVFVYIILLAVSAVPFFDELLLIRKFNKESAKTIVAETPAQLTDNSEDTDSKSQNPNQPNQDIAPHTHTHTHTHTQGELPEN